MRYDPVIRAYLVARWNNSPLAQEIGDACQEFFVECFREGGPLDRAEPGHDGGFRAFLYGIVRNIALRWEQRVARNRARPLANDVDFSAIQSDETSLSQVFDRAWTAAVLREAAERQAENAEQSGPDAVRRVELLRLRFREGLPIRQIAELWQTDAAHLHREYAKARQEFKQSLGEVVAFHHPDATPGEVQLQCSELLTMYE